MSWKWLIDVRGQDRQVDGKRLAVVLIVGSLVGGAIMRLVPPPLNFIVTLTAGLALIALDVYIRRHD